MIRGSLLSQPYGKAINLYRRYNVKTNSVLVHCCCAHCIAYTVDYWGQQGYEVSALWYNPNIHPYMEHQHRLEAIKSFSQEVNLPLIIIEHYDIIDYFRQVTRHEPERCHYCFRLRLLKTAETACKMGFNAFTTSLLISPHQKHDLLRKIGSAISREEDIEFLYADLRKQYSESRNMTKMLDLYRQQYCGCVYSEWERHANRD
jgi:predicted adenine nucleotide alpha hydrolase (AANH) superfamily ATPase